MKTIFRFVGTGALATAILAVGALTGFAQDAPNNCADIDGHNALYTKFTENYRATVLAQMETALTTGKEYLEKYGTCTEAFKDQIEFVRPQVASLEKRVEAKRVGDRLAPIFKRYDAGINADNPDEILGAGKEILAVRKDDINILVPMALVASYKSTKENNYKYADDGIRYANQVAALIRGGAEFTKKDAKGAPVVGVLKYTYTKDQVLNELMFANAYLTFYGKKDKKTALPIYYELSQAPLSKNDPRVYGTIGDYYIEEGAPIGEQIAKLIADQKAATDDAVKADLDTKIKAQIALFNGYTERALDAYSRAHNVAKSDTPAAKAYKDNLYKIMQGLYKRRFEKETGLDAFVATTLAKPFPNPTSPVTPISDPEPTTTTTTTTSGSTSTAAPAAKPAATTTTPTKPVSGVATKAATAKKASQK